MKSHRETTHVTSCEMPADQAAPLIPSSGKGPRPNIRKGSRTAPRIAAVVSAYME